MDSGGKRRENRLLNGDARTVSREKIQSFESVEQKHPEVVSRGLCLHDARRAFQRVFFPSISPISPSIGPQFFNYLSFESLFPFSRHLSLFFSAVARCVSLKAIGAPKYRRESVIGDGFRREEEGVCRKESRNDTKKNRD